MASSSAPEGRSDIVRSGDGRGWCVFNTMTFIRDNIHYTQLQGGTWRAEFRGLAIRAVATGSTLERARAKLLDTLDEQITALLKADVTSTSEDGMA